MLPPNKCPLSESTQCAIMPFKSALGCLPVLHKRMSALKVNFSGYRRFVVKKVVSFCICRVQHKFLVVFLEVLTASDIPQFLIETLLARERNSCGSLVGRVASSSSLLRRVVCLCTSCSMAMNI